MKMNFLRSVKQKDVTAAFEDGLKANNIDTSLPHIKSFIEAVKNSKKFKKKSETLVIGLKSGNTETLVFKASQNDKEVVIDGPKGFVQSVFNMWFGKTTDADLETLKKELAQLK